MIYVGIDPGLTGAVAAIYDDNAVRFFDTPVYADGKKNLFDETEAAAILRNLMQQGNNFGNLFVTIEKVHAMCKGANGAGGQGATSAFSFGMGFGCWKGILAALNIPRQLVTPQAWKKETMAGENKEKQASIAVAKRLFPATSDQYRKPKGRVDTLNGRSDALLMAEFGRRIHARKAA